MDAKRCNYRRRALERRPPASAAAPQAASAPAMRAGAARARLRSTCGASEPDDHAGERGQQAGQLAPGTPRPGRHVRQEQQPDADAQRDRRRSRPGWWRASSTGPITSGTKAPTSVHLVGARTPGRRSACPASRSRRPAPARLKTSDRDAHGQQLLLVGHAAGAGCFRMFSTKLVAGASSVADDGALDGRQQRAEEQDLHHERHLRQHEGRQHAAA